MRTILTRIFVTLGVVFFGILCGVTYFVVVDPYHLRPVVQLLWEMRTTSVVTVPAVIPGSTTTVGTTMLASTTPIENSVIPSKPEKTVLPSAQVKALESVGIDPSLISHITPEQQACFVQLIGQERVMSIIAGAVPTADEFLKASACL